MSNSKTDVVVHTPASQSEPGRGLCGATTGRTCTRAASVTCAACKKAWNTPATANKAV
jgi:hypothetical protein